MTRFVRLSVSALLALVLALPCEAGWRELHPIFGGAVKIIAADAAGDLYAVGSGGLFRWEAGQWSSALGNLPTTDITVLTPDPVQVGTLYAGTDKGIFRTTDGGATWTRLPLNLPGGITVTAIAVAPGNTARIYVATWGSYVWRSLDRGATWSRSSAGLTGGWGGPAFIPHVAVDPIDPDRVYANTWRGRMFRSDDGAASWIAIADAGTWAAFEFHVSRSHPNVLYMLHDEFWFGRGSVLRSADSGNTWTNAGRPAPYLGSTNVARLAIHPTDPNTVYVTTGHGVYKSTTGGGIWSRAFAPATGLAGMNPVAIDSATPARVFAGSYYTGFYYSSDGGLTWDPSNDGMALASISGLGLCRDVPTTLYAAAQGHGHVKSADGGVTWSAIGSALRQHGLGGIAVHPQNPNVMVTSTWDGSVSRTWRTTDGGATFTPTSTSYGPAWFRFNPADPSYVHATISDWQGGFLRSADGGASWSVPYFWYIYPNDFAFHPALPNVVFSIGFQYTGAPQNTLWILWSNNYGATWTGASFGFGHWDELALDQRSPATLYGVGRMPSDGSAGVYKFNVTYSGGNVAGVTRVPGTFNSGLGNANVRKLHYDAAKGYLYATTPNGVYRTADQALSWTTINDGLPYVSTDWIAGSPDGERLFIATSGGIWEYSDALPVPVATPVVRTSPSNLLTTVVAGSTLQMSAAGETTTTADTITLAATGLVANMGFTSTPGNPAAGMLTFTPGGNQRGQTYPVGFTAASTLDPSKTSSITRYVSVIGSSSTDAAALIGPATDGTVNTPDGSFSLDIPAGAIGGSSLAAVNVAYESNYRRADVNAQIPPQRGKILVLSAYDITINGLDHFTFASPVALTFRYEAGMDPSQIVVMTFNEATGEMEPRTDTSCLASFGRQAVTGSSATGGTISICTTTVSIWAIADRSTFVFDTQPPLLSFVRFPAPNAAGWNDEPVAVDFTCTDDGSGVLTHPVDVVVETEGAAQSVSATCRDRANNLATATVPDISIDRTPPAIALASPANGGAYILGQPALADYGCTDALSGIESCGGTTSSGAPVPTSTVGPATFAVVAADRAGNASTTISGYVVRYAFSGFLAPLKAVPATLTARAGQTVPVKWQLRDAAGAFVTDPASFVSLHSAPIACDSTPAAITGEPALAAGGTTLRYDTADHQFVFNWQTRKEWNGCRLLQLSLRDGATHWSILKFE